MINILVESWNGKMENQFTQKNENQGTLKGYMHAKDGAHLRNIRNLKIPCVLWTCATWENYKAQHMGIGEFKNTNYFTLKD